MILLPTLNILLVVFFALAGVGALLVLGVLGEAVARNRHRRITLRQPVFTYYRQLVVSH